jgi:hypothetical protein
MQIGYFFRSGVFGELYQLDDEADGPKEALQATAALMRRIALVVVAEFWPASLTLTSEYGLARPRKGIDWSR